MRRHPLVASCLLALILTVAAIAAIAARPADGDRPPGVPAASWKAFTPELGLYYQVETNDSQLRPGMPRERVRGTFMAKIHGTWVVVQPNPAWGPYFLGDH
jgi:hypothetical protein